MKQGIMTTVLTAVLALASPAGTAQAADRTGQYAVKGLGGMSCSQYLQERSAGSKLYQSSATWIAGYISAYNRLTPATMDISPWQDGPLFLDLLANVCSANRTRSVEAAVNGTLAALTRQRLDAADRMETRALPGGKAQFYTSVWRRIEQRLKATGHLKGAGTDPKALAAGLRSFQAARKLKPTGLPDQGTLYKLLMEGQ